MKIEIEVQDEQEAQAIRMVIAERRRQDDKFGKQDHDLSWWMVILGEEFGETCEAICEYRWGDVARPSDHDSAHAPTRLARVNHTMAETSQVAAVGVAMIQAILRNEWRDEISTVIPSDKRKVAKALGRGHEDIDYGTDI